MELMLVGFVLLSYKLTEIYCQIKKLPAKSSFYCAFIVNALSLSVVSIIVHLAEIDGLEGRGVNIFLWVGGVLILSIGAGIKCKINAHKYDY